jgi:hypothetical protein
VFLLISISILFGQINITGYVETRPYLAWSDSVNVYGYNRGWLEFKSSDVNYGTQLAFDCVVPYDSIPFANIVESISISRLALWLGPENLRITVGKQRLYWGVARVFRPLDIFNPLNFLEPGYERPGYNAILGYASIGALTSLRGIYVPQYNLKRSFLGLRFGTNLMKNDVGFNFMHRSSERRTIVGAEVTGDFIVGYWSEFSYTWEDTTQYAKISTGIDYTFPFFIYGMVEYFYDGSGETDPNNYNFTQRMLGERMLLAQQYLYVSIGTIHNPFLRPSINAVINLNDGGTILIPQISYSVFENTEVTFGLNFFLGSQSSEFKSLLPFDGQIYMWARVYF